jgi:integrase/recombinase XerD
MDPVITEQLSREHPLARYLDEFLADLANAGASRHILRAYRGDLLQFAAHHDGEIAELTVVPVRAYLAGIAELTAASRKRKRAAVASFCRWAVRHDLLAASPMDKIDTVKVPRTLPRPVAAADVAKVLAAICSRRPRKDIPLDRLRDRCCSRPRTPAARGPPRPAACTSRTSTCGRPTSTCGSTAKGGTVRTVLLDDRGYVTLLKLYLARAGYTSGPLFRASINGGGGPLSYDAAHHRWEGYSAAAGLVIDIHQLRHAHATELINSGVSIEAVRRSLGHASSETTQLYALLEDKVADAEVRAARRRRDRAAR